MIAPLNELKSADILRLRDTRKLHIFELANLCKCSPADVAYLLYEHNVPMKLDEIEYLIKFLFVLGLSDTYIITKFNLDRVLVYRVCVSEKLSETWMNSSNKFYDKVLYYLWVKLKLSTVEISECLNISEPRVCRLLYTRDPSITFDSKYKRKNKTCLTTNNAVNVTSMSRSTYNEFYVNVLPLIEKIGEDIFDFIDKKYSVFGVDTIDRLKLLSSRYLALQAGASVAEVAVLSHSTRQTINIFANRFIIKPKAGVNISVYAALDAAYKKLHTNKYATDGYKQRMRTADGNRQRALELAQQGYTPQGIADELGISRASVYSYSREWPADFRVKVLNRSRASTRDRRAKIRKLAADGVSEAEIARQLNVNPITVKCALACADA